MPERYATTIQNIGRILQWLISQDQILHAVKGERGIIDALKRVRESLKEIKFDQRWVYQELDTWTKKLSRYKLNQNIKKETADQLSYDSDNWYREVIDYLSNCYYWEIRPKGVSDLDNLLEKKKDIIFKNKNYWKKLSGIAKHDIQEACLCLAFERPTAAAFLIMRATEDVLRNLYDSKTKKPLTGFIDWGEITQQLRNKVSRQLIENLDYLRNNFRNPVAHPEKIYEQIESDRLLHVAISIIEQMIDEIPPREGGRN